MTLRVLPAWTEDAEITRVRRSVLPAPAPAPMRVEVDLDAIADNARAVQARVGAGTGVLAMLKANAYGHGLAPVATELDRDGTVAGFVVTSVVDALVLEGLRVARPIVCMPSTWEGRHEEVLARGIVPVIGSHADLQRFAHVARRLPGRSRVHLKLDTGMARLGIREDGIEEALALLRAAPWIAIDGVCTHLATADETDVSGTGRQLEAFAQMRARLLALGHRPAMTHAANTAATWRHPRARFDHVRTGIALFGGDAPSGARLAPALRFVTQIVQLRTVRAGETVSYGERWRAARPSVVATLPVGYAQGYPRRGAGAEALVHGRHCPVIGTVCMEMMLVDVTDLARPAVGDEVVLLGDQGEASIPVSAVADRIDGIVEEIFCGLSREMPREYVRRGRRTSLTGTS